MGQINQRFLSATIMIGQLLAVDLPSRYFEDLPIQLCQVIIVPEDLVPI